MECDGQPVPRPELKKGGQIILHVRNFNDYIYTLQVRTTEKDRQVPATGLGDLLSAGQTLDVLNQIRQLSNVTDMQRLGGFGEPDKIRGEKDMEIAMEESWSAEAEALRSHFSTAFSQFQETEANLIRISEDIQLDIQSQQYNHFMQGEIARIKANPDLPPQDLQRIALEYMEQILDVDTQGDMDFQKLIARADIQGSIGQKIQNFRQETSRMRDHLSELAATTSLLRALAIPTSEKLDYGRTLEQARSRTSTFEQKAGDMEAQIQNLKNWDMRELAEIRYQYEEMKNHRFEKKSHSRRIRT
jgi:hypothetical protein